VEVKLRSKRPASNNKKIVYSPNNKTRRVETQVTQKKQWTLTGEAFDKLLARLDEDRERAGEKYEQLRLKLVKFFDYRGSLEPDEHADETLNRVTRKIDEGEAIENLQAYCYGTARLFFLDVLKERKKVPLEDAPELVQEADFDRESEADLQYRCFDGCLQKLPAENRELILGYYEDEKRDKIDKRKNLAERFGLELNALRIRTCRIRTKLEMCVADCVGRD